MEDIKVTIGKNIRIFRKQKGSTLQSLSKQIGITHQQLSKIENGAGTATFTLERIAAVLNVDMKNLMEEPEANLKNSISHIENFVPKEVYNKLCSDLFQNIIKSVNDVVIERYKEKIENKLIKNKCKILELIDISIVSKGDYEKNKYKFTFTKSELETFCYDLILNFASEILELSKIDYGLDDE